MDVIQIEFILWNGLDKDGKWIGGKEYFFSYKGNLEVSENYPARQNYVIAKVLNIPEAVYWDICKKYNNHDGDYHPNGQEHFEKRAHIMSCMVELGEFCKQYYKTCDIKKNIRINEDKIIIEDK